MKQNLFEQRYQQVWSYIEAQLAGPKAEIDPELPHAYRQLCQCLALARQRGYSPGLIKRLSQLALDCHRLLYSAPDSRPMQFLAWTLGGFPRLVRAQWRVNLLALGLFCLCFAIPFALICYDSTLAYSFLDHDTLWQMERMYTQTDLHGTEDDIEMFGHYIANNVGIAFQTFAGGILFGLGSLLVLCFNGMHIGVISAWLHLNPATHDNFWSFVITHGALELTGIIISAAAGLKLGWALFSPGQLSRGAALRQEGRTILPMLLGAAVMIFLAAFIEAFWSGNPAISHEAKYAVGATLWVLVLAYFLLGGRRNAA